MSPSQAALRTNFQKARQADVSSAILCVFLRLTEISNAAPRYAEDGREYSSVFKRFTLLCKAVPVFNCTFPLSIYALFSGE